MEPTTVEYTHNNTPENSVDKDAALSYALSEDQIVQMRARQKEAFYLAQAEANENGASLDEAIPIAKEAAQKVGDEYVNTIAETGFFDTDTVGRTSNIVQEYSFLNMSEHEWRLGKVDNDGVVERKSGRERLEEATRQLIEPEEVSADSTVESKADDPYLEAEQNKLVSLREAVADLSAKRQGHIFGDGGERYERALSAYNEQVVKLGKLEKKAIIEDDTLSDVTKKAEVTMYLFQEQNKLRELSMEKIQGTKVSKFIEWMNKGNFAQRVAKGALIGIGASVAAAGFGAVLGVAGAAAATGVVTAAAVGTARFARGFARSDGKKGRGMQVLDDISHLEEVHDSTDTTDLDDIFSEVNARYHDKYEKDISKEQAKRRRSVAAGAIGIALGGTVGFAAHAVADAGLFDGWMNRGPSLPFGDSQVGATDSGAGAGEGAPPLIGDTNGDGVVNELDTQSSVPPDTHIDTAPPEIFADPHFVIESGEGGIHFFQDLGLSESNWYEVHHELLEKFPGDFYSMGDGQVGLAHQGQLSLEAQQFIKTRFGLL